MVPWPDNCLSAKTCTIVPRLFEFSNEVLLSSPDNGTSFVAHGGAFSCTGWIDNWGRANSSSSSEIPDLQRLGERDDDRDSDLVSGPSRKIELPREWDIREERDWWPLSAIEKCLGLVRCASVSASGREGEERCCDFGSAAGRRGGVLEIELPWCSSARS